MTQWGGYPQPSRPRAVKSGGIPVESKRGDIGKAWWSRRWVEALESFAVSSRLERGRRYARAGQVAKVEVATEGAKAKVQGSRARPYNVAVRLRALDDAAWERTLDAMAAQARFAAALLAGDVPHDIDDAFKAAGQSMFPSEADDLETDCSCPDWENPCKHVAAVHYVLAERFDADPFLLFSLRGRDRDQVLDGLRSRRSAPSGSRRSRKGSTKKAKAAVGTERPFWDSPVAPSTITISMGAPAEDALLIHALGVPPVWNSSQADPQGLVDVYRRTTSWALALAYGDRGDDALVARRRLGSRRVDAAGRLRYAKGTWYVGRDWSGRTVEVFESADGTGFARSEDGRTRALKEPAGLKTMPPEA